MSRTPLAAVALLAACLLAACTDDDPKPDIADPTPSAPSSTATAGSTSPTVSASPALGPVGTVNAWIDARNRALRDGDTTDVDSLSASNCRSCEELNKVIREVYAAGGSFNTAGWTIDSIKQKPGAEPIQVDTALTFAPGQTIPSEGADPVSFGEEKHIVTFRLSGTAQSLKVQLVLFR